MEARPDVERRSEAGFSVIEGLIAAALLLIVTVGVLPLFSRSMLNNVKGNDSTRQANGAIDAFERDNDLPFNSGDMALTAGTERVDELVIALKEMPGSDIGAMSTRWEPRAALAAGDIPQTVRRRRVRYFEQSNFNPTSPQNSFQDPLSFDEESQRIQFKVIDLTIFDEVHDPLAASPTAYRMRLIKSW